MIALYLIAAHLLGDFVLSDRWTARRKLDDIGVRAMHSTVYCLPFFPVAFYAAAPRDASAFLYALCALHFLTDGRRVRSTLGDWIRWQLMGPAVRADELAEERIVALRLGDYHSAEALAKLRPSPEKAARAKVPPNPWEPVGLLVDQTLHLCQIALLGGLLLT